jgi:hypothetical protein
MSLAVETMRDAWSGCRWPWYAPLDVKRFRPQNGTVGGTVSEAGVPLEGVRVLLHWRRAMVCIGITYTNAAGEFLFTGLDPTAGSEYVVVIQDKVGGTVYNDAIFALVAAT